MRSKTVGTALACAATIVVCALASSAPGRGGTAGALEPGTVTGEVRYAGGSIAVTFKPSQFSFSAADLTDWVNQSARAVSLFFGRFPVTSARLDVEPISGPVIAKGSATSATEPHIHLLLGRTTTARDLERLSVLAHEMTHLAIPALDIRQIWLHEGIATYVEFVGRAQAGLVSPQQMWTELVRDLPNGLPGRGDSGLDDTPSEDRRYWGGALFCLLADIEIRKATANRYGLQDGLRQVQHEGGNLSHVWPVGRTLGAAYRGTGTHVLSTQFRNWSAHAVAPDLNAVWRDLGIRSAHGRVLLDDSAPLAAIRRAITSAGAEPLLVSTPRLLREAAMR